MFRTKETLGVKNITKNLINSLNNKFISCSFLTQHRSKKYKKSILHLKCVKYMVWEFTTFKSLLT